MSKSSTGKRISKLHVNRSQLIRRIAMPYFVLIAVIITVAMVISYSLFISQSEINAEKDARTAGENVVSHIEDYINDMEIIANQVNRQPRITGVFYELKYNGTDGNAFDSDVLMSIDVSSALYGLIRDRADNYNICVYNRDGDFISSRTYMVDKEAFESQFSAGYYDGILGAILSGGGRDVSGPEKDAWSLSDTEYIAVKTALKNDLASDACGIIEVRGRPDVLKLETFLPEAEGSSITITGKGSEILYTASSGEKTDDARNISVQVPGTEWAVEIGYPNPVTPGYILRILGVFLLILLLLIGFIFFVTYTIGSSVTKPIMKLARRVKSINAPNEQINIVDDTALDEIKDLEASFDKMLERVNQSAMQEKKAYSLALQAQMNPHFLYNTLSIIGAAGEEAGASNVTDMCVKLSDMLRYVASYEKITVPLKEEIAHTSNYLSLMKSRYEDYFDYSISVDDELLNMAVPKLFIQPLAENCFKHGFKMSPPPWNIDIKMHGNNSHWELIIRDNGVGITDERIAQIDEKIKAAISEMSLSGNGGVGLVNTIVRLKLTHSKRLNYSIRSVGGTVVRITADAE